MERLTAARIRLALAFVWTSATIILLLILSALILLQPNFPLNLGFIRTTGRAGLVGTLLPALVGLTGLTLLFMGAMRRKGALVLACYSGFWAAVFLSGLPSVWYARRSFCLKGLNFCIISPWVAKLTVIGIALPFVLAGICFLLEARDSARHAIIASDAHAGMQPR
jgi:hypothetical protein